MHEPLSPAEARRQIRSIVADGTVVFSRHALDELANDGLSVDDGSRVLRAGWVEPAEFENGSWRYRVRTQGLCVVIVILAEDSLPVVTAWKVRR